MGRNLINSSAMANVLMEYVYETEQGRRWHARMLEENDSDTESMQTPPSDTQDNIQQQQSATGQTITPHSPQDNPREQAGRPLGDQGPTT